MPVVSSSLPHSGLTDMLLLLYINNNRSNSPPRLMGIAHCPQSLLAPVQPDKPPALCRRGSAGFCSQELKNLLQLHPSRTSSITPLRALWSEVTVHPHPLPTARRQVWLDFILIHITNFSGAWSLRAIHLFCSQVLLGNTLLGFPHPSLLAISSLSLAGHFLSLPLNQRVFFPFLKGACNIYCMVLESLD